MSGKAPREGMMLAEQAQQLTEKMQDGVYTAPAQAEGIQGGAQAVQFRRKFDARDRYDDEMNTKMQLMDKDGMTPFGQVYYDDKVGRWLERKAATLEAANFDRYFNQNFNKNDLAARQFAQQINPEFYSQRMAEMNERANMVVKLKAIQLRGPQSKEDLYMLWLIESGRVVLPEDWDRIAPGMTGTEDSDEWKKEQDKSFANLFAGLIRMPLFLSEKQRTTQAEQNKTGGYFGSSDFAKNFFGANGEPGAGNAPLTNRNKGSTMASLFLDKTLKYGE